MVFSKVFQVRIHTMFRILSCQLKNGSTIKDAISRFLLFLDGQIAVRGKNQRGFFAHKSTLNGTSRFDQFRSHDDIYIFRRRHLCQYRRDPFLAILRNGILGK